MVLESVHYDILEYFNEKNILIYDKCIRGAKNVEEIQLYLNKIHDKVTLLPLALSDRMGSNLLRMTTTEWGGALSTFGENVGWDG